MGTKQDYVIKQIATHWSHDSLSLYKIWTCLVKLFLSYLRNNPTLTNIWTVLSLTVPWFHFLIKRRLNFVFQISTKFPGWKSKSLMVCWFSFSYFSSHSCSLWEIHLLISSTCCWCFANALAWKPINLAVVNISAKIIQPALAVFELLWEHLAGCKNLKKCWKILKIFKTLI